MFCTALNLCEDIAGNSTNIFPKRKASGSNPLRRAIMNDPTQFEQVDETCGLSGVILCLKSLDVTAFLRIDAPWKI